MMAAYRCPGCDYVYHEAKGAAREGFPPGTPWQQVPEDWCCPDCGVREKVDFETMRPMTMRAAGGTRRSRTNMEVNK
jgi:rubredoxin